MAEEVERLTRKQIEKLRDIRRNLEAPCFCESYHDFMCARCRRLAKQGAGDPLVGEVVTKQVLDRYKDQLDAPDPV